MDYSEVSSTFSKLVETHFLQRCPPLPRVGNKDSSAASETPAAPGTPAAPVNTAPPTPESFPECYKVPSVTLIGRGKRQLASEDGEEQRSAKRAKMDPEVSFFLTFLVTLTNLQCPPSIISTFPLVIHVTFYFSVCLSYALLHSAQTHGDEGIYWQVNFERFHLHFRDQTIISAVANKLDQVMGKSIIIFNLRTLIYFLAL